MSAMKQLKKLMLLAVIWALPLAIGQFPVGVSFGDAAQAAEATKKTRKVPAMRERTYKKLAEAQIMIDPDSAPREEGEPAPIPKGTVSDAVRLLHELMGSRGLNSYEKAQIWNTLAFAYYTLEDMPKTVNAYEQILKQGTISEALELSSLRALFQLYYSNEKYRKAIKYIDRFQALQAVKDPQITFFKATAYYQLNEFRESLKQAILVEEIAVARRAGRIESNQAIIADAKATPEQKQEARRVLQKIQGTPAVKENWWYLQVVLYNELEDIDSVIRLLETLIVNYPKKQYWMHLAGMYSEKSRDDDSLSAYYATYIQGFLVKESEIVMVAQRLLGADNPYEASQVLEKGFKDESIEENEKNLRLLATAYTLSQETNSAIDAWRDATKYAEDGDLYFRLAQALSAEDRHKEAVKAYSDAQKKGDLKKPGDVAFWKGISQMQLERWDSATKSFRSAAKLDKKKAKQSRQYIRYIAGERRRQEELRKMLEGVGE
ncbi:MAG: tetratricopeptide repeat protein [Gammaproteobacteria bacterium]|jgi:tetratricopeptide (TPR) repeat protein|nr:tetratricopeptide repeat protein [Gammaproteobacteria bacterium]MBT3868025.1 tetratricopeptide repeat protein [Gammaproteobacteria bacterium]MBT4617000.1 tetratricopeptide repeat protein [Gammaproteobacteria bacterium]MBT5199209.1 tetratricopeptide repeat protein [Gammaproteobacteria bacterium]MBT5791829.1 tetratricopeptide repeat protein [Gammaproteobacteria bacterium]